MITVDLPFPPSVNNLFRNAQKGRVKTERYAEWANVAGWMLKSQKPGRVEGKFALALVVQRKDNRKRDIGNLLKAVEDLLVEHGVIQDDSLAERIHIAWGEAPEGCRVTVGAVS
ncbi:RusA family crossover junction endodeoxyribonuclease [Agaricicola taiwanensis]|nr:RusA family crossover junction endodeoxyribonuclease [Agaricicola taiwanensis]